MNLIDKRRSRRGAVLGLAAFVAVTVALGGAGPAGATFPGANGKIAFTTDRDGNQEVYVINADGSGPTRLTNDPAQDIAGSWSPNGEKIAFSTARDGNFEIYVMNADGTDQTNLTDDAAWDIHPAWSPDGTKIAFLSNRDGDFDIYVMGVDGSSPTNLTNGPGDDGRAAWSPDGTRIAFGRDPGPGLDDVYVMDADGSNQTNLTNHPSNDAGPDWSPDGQQIVFHSARDGFGAYEIYVMNADGSSPTNLTNNPGGDNQVPSWSPDGQNIAFSSRRDGNYDIYVMNADGTGQTNLTTNPAFDVIPAWQPIEPPTLCSRTGDVLTIDVPSGDSVTIGLAGASFNVTGGGNPDPTCGGSTVNNVNTVNVNGTAGNETVTYDTSGGNFEPGATPEGTGISEIEFNLSLGAGSDTLIAQLGALKDKFTIGSNGVNPNGDTDRDLTLVGVENLSVKGGEGNDAIRAFGKNGTGGPYPTAVELQGEGGSDTLTGGLGDDSIDGGTGDDTFKALNVADGADDFVGGAGADTANYDVRPSSAGGVTVDTDNIADDGTNPAGEGDNIRSDVERVVGSKGGDLIDDGGQVVKNVFKGGDGNDTINTVDGVGNDKIDGGAGAGDACSGDPGDTITNCP